MARAGICTIAGKTRSVYEMIALAKSSGAEAVEIWGQPPHITYPLDFCELTHIADFAQSAGITICALGSYYTAGKKVSFSGIEVTVENQIEAAKALGTHTIRIWAGSRNYEEYRRIDRESLYAELRYFGQAARREDITVVLERHTNTLLNRWENVEEVFKRIDSPNIYLNYQIVYPAKLCDYRSKSINDYKSLLKISKHAHLQNYILKPDGHLVRTFLSEGAVDYSLLGEAVDESRYEGYLMVEFPAEVDEGCSIEVSLKRDIDYIKSL